ATPQRVAPTAQLTIGSPAPMVIEIDPAVVNCFECFCRRGLHAPQPTKNCADLVHTETSQGCFDPLHSLARLAILRFGHLVEILGTMIVVEYLTSLGKQRLHVFPYPLSAIAYHTQPRGLLGDHAGVFHLLQGLAHVLFIGYLMPTEHMDNALAV